jgi:hypothetical protein
MEKNSPKGLINLIKKGLIAFNHKNDEVKENYCSLGLPSLNVIVKGQWGNSRDSKNAVLSFFRANTSKLLGKSLGFLWLIVEVLLFKPIFTAL